MTTPPPPDDQWGSRETPWSQPAPPPPPYGGMPPGMPPQPPPPTSGTPVLSIIAFVAAAIAILFIPILFGLAGIALGTVGHFRGETLGKWAALTSGVTMILGVFLGILIGSMSI